MRVTPGLYQHYKGGRYEVIGEARHTETEEDLVLYRALYGERGLWVRPLDMFCETVEVESKQVPRFALLSAAD
ncbi:MAG: DUF1653 domain-containing protein [Pseudomonadales bacterium]|nr:DUF1653 domain-containing protein [Pseudomonadales bacterium]MDG2079147.1 DUF1653 domain-containing protein [Pseudomonadales bacterium]